MTHLNDLSKAYLDQIAEKKKDDTYLEPDMKKRQANNEKARKDLMKGPQMKNPHFEEKQLDPVGQEDGDVNNDGKKDSTDKYLMKRRKAIAKAMKKESFVKSDWRTSISEVMTDIESQPIKEKKVKNKIKINPTMGEAIEEIGGTLIEEIEVEDLEDVIECVYGELIEEGYTEDEVESAIEQALTEATVTMGHDSYGPQKAAPKPAERTRDKLKKKAKGFLGKVAVKAYNKAREAKAAATPAVQRAKTSAKRGIRKMAQKVVDRMSEEIMGEAVYGGTKKPAPTDKRLTVTNADKAGNTPAYQAYKAGDKRYKAADHMKEEQVDEEKKPLPKTKMFRKAGNLGRDAISTPIDPEKRQKAYDRSKKIIKTLNQNEGYGAPGHNPGSGEKSVARAKALMDKQGRKGAPGLDAMAAAKKEHEARRGVKKEEVEPKKSEKKRGKLPHMGTGNPHYDAKSAGISRAKGFKFTPVKEEASMSPQEVALQKKKAMIDKMIASKRMQGLKSAKKSEAPTKAMGEDADLDKMQKDADANRARAAKLKDRNVTRGSAALAARAVERDVKKAAKTGPQQYPNPGKGVKKIEKPKPTHTKTGAMRVEGLSIDKQMEISKEYNRKSPEERKAANMKALSGIKKGTPKKDTRTDAQKMTDATGPRPGSRYRGD